jgi:hypothetical protein
MKSKIEDRIRRIGESIFMLEHRLYDLEELFKNLEKLFKKQNETQTKKKSWPQKGDTIYFLDVTGKPHHDTFYTNETHKAIADFLGIYKTKEEAERVSRYITLLTALDHFTRLHFNEPGLLKDYIINNSTTAIQLFKQFLKNNNIDNDLTEYS